MENVSQRLVWHWAVSLLHLDTSTHSSASALCVPQPSPSWDAHISQEALWDLWNYLWASSLPWGPSLIQGKRVRLWSVVNLFTVLSSFFLAPRPSYRCWSTTWPNFQDSLRRFSRGFETSLLWLKWRESNTHSFPRGREGKKSTTKSNSVLRRHSLSQYLQTQAFYSFEWVGWSQ